MENQKAQIQCSLCNTTDSICGMCHGYHFVCGECHQDFPTCSTCFGDFLPLDENLPEYPEGLPLNNGTGQSGNTLNVKISRSEPETTDVNKTKYFLRKKKKPIDQCKESFFLGVWDSVTCSLLSSKSVSFRHFLTTTSARISKRMGKALLSVMSSSKSNNGGNNMSKDSVIFPLSVGLLLLLIASQLVFQKQVVPRTVLSK